MVAESESSERLRVAEVAPVWPPVRAWWRRGLRLFARFRFTSLSSRIIILNVVGLIVLVSGILYLNQFRQGLIDARVESLLTQGQIIAGAVAASATVDPDAIMIDPDRLRELHTGEALLPQEDLTSLEFPINPERVAPILRRLISPTKTRARLYDREGVLIVDSRHLYGSGQILRFDLPPPTQEGPGFIERLWQRGYDWLFSGHLPLQQEFGMENGREYPEVRAALSGASVSVVRVNERDEIIVSVAVPVQRFRAVLGALVLSTRGGDIDAIVSAERWAIVRVFLVAVFVTVLLSFLLAGTIAEPVRKLASAAERVRRGVQKRVEIPDFTSRRDEIGDLSGALRDMTTALYNRIDAIENFAADVAHELKNPLTSLLSAVETLPRVKDDAARKRLIEIVRDDVKRLDRLITDISDASRLDAELARAEAAPVDIALLLDAVTGLANETRRPEDAPIVLRIVDSAHMPREKAFRVMGHDSRLGQVLRNVLDNARSFAPPGSTVRVTARRVDGEVEFIVDDDGPGIRPESLNRIFDRFHTDRPGEDAFGKNSGLGLSISRQIVEAHRGRIWAENRHDEAGQTLGARFIVRLPASERGSSRP